MADIVVSFEEETELELTEVDIGKAEDDNVLAFTVEGVIRGLESDLVQQLIGKEVVPTEIHFRVEGE